MNQNHYTYTYNIKYFPSDYMYKDLYSKGIKVRWIQRHLSYYFAIFEDYII
jgi:hypothetical protein